MLPSDAHLATASKIADDLARRQALTGLATVATRAIIENGVGLLGRLSVAPAREDNNFAYFAQLRSKPLVGFGGVEFRYDVPRRAVHDYAGHVPAIVESARRFVHVRPEIERLAGSVEEWLASLRLPANRTGHLKAFGATVRADQLIELHADIEMLGFDLRVGIERYRSSSPVDLNFKLCLARARHDFREPLSSKLREAAADGWIDEIACRIIDASALDRAKAFELLRENRILRFRIDKLSGLEASLYWADGVVVGSLTGEGWRFTGGELIIDHPHLPETVQDALIGQPLGRLAELPVLPADAPMTSIRHEFDRLSVKFRTSTKLFDIATAEVRESGQLYARLLNSSDVSGSTGTRAY